MAPNDNVEETIVRLREDRAARRQLTKGIGEVRRELDGIGTAADKALDQRVSRATTKGIRNLRALGDAAKRARGDFDFSDVNFGDLEGGGRRAGFGRRAGGNRRTISTGVAIRNLPAIGPSEPIAKAVTTLGRAGASLGQLGVIAGVATPLLIGVKVAFDQFNASVAASAQTFRTVLDARRESLRIVANSTRDELDLERQAAAQRLRDQQRDLNDLLQVRARVSAGLDESGLLGQVFNVIGESPGGGGPLGEVRGAIEEVRAEIEGTTALLNEYDVALDNNATSLKDSIALLKEQRAALDASIVAQLSLQRQFATEDDTSVIDRRLNQLAAERDLINQTIDAGNLSVEAETKLRDERTKVASQISTLAILIRPLVAEREKEADAAKRLTDIITGIPGRLKEAANAFDEVKEAASRIQDLRDDFALKISDILRRGQEKIEDAERDRLDSIADAQRDAADDIQEAQREAGRERVDIERDTARDINRIRRRSLFDEQNAIQGRDAVSLDAARRRRDLEISETNDDAKERLRDLKDNLREQTRTIRRALDNQIRVARTRFNRQVRDAGIAAQRTIAVEREKFQRELAVRTQAAQAALGIQVRSEQQRTQIAASGAGQRLQVEAGFVQASLNLWQSALRAVSGASATRRPIGASTNTRGGTNTRGFSPTAFQDGGIVGRDGMAFVHRGEVITNPRRGQQAPGGGVQIAINGTGMSPRQIGREVERQLTSFVEGHEA